MIHEELALGSKRAQERTGAREGDTRGEIECWLKRFSGASVQVMISVSLMALLLVVLLYH